MSGVERERDVKKEKKKNQVAKNQFEKRIFFIRLRIEFKRPAKKKVSQKDFFPSLYLSNQVCPLRVRGSSIGVDVIFFFVRMYSYVSICQTTSDRFLEGKE